MHGTVLVVDVAGFGDLRRTNIHQVAVRGSLYRMLSQALTEADVDWLACHREDRGDGILVVIPATAPKSPLVETVPPALVRLLAAHNDGHGPEEQIRLRMALHAGEVLYDEHGVAGRAVTLAFRLVDAPVFKQALTESLEAFALITSAWFYEEVVWHVSPAGYQQVVVDAKETSTTAWIWLPGSPARAAPAVPVPALHQLPTNVRQFAGRAAELDRMMRLLDDATTDKVIITAIDGSAGIGKTTLALHWAHQVKDRFPDGQLHVNLRGFDPGEPMDAGQALHEFLQALGVAPIGIPAQLNAKAAMYRSRLAGKRMLIMLDNARSVEHVRPLLPGTSSCLVVITSRNRLDSLVVREGAVRVDLDVMSRPEATALLNQRIGADRLTAQPEAVADIISLCASLPLALSIVAARAADYPNASLATLAQELQQERSRLDALDRGDMDLSVRTVFSWSHEILSPAAARLFRLLGIHPGPDIDIPGSDALAGEPTRAALNELIRAHMLAEYIPGRYRFHDLLRSYAAELGRADPEWTVAAGRLLDHYVETALQADLVLQPCRDGVVRTPPTDLTYPAAMSWFVAENEVLLAAITFAADNGFGAHAWRLAWACTTYLRRVGRYVDRMIVHQVAAGAARRAGDRLGLATALRNFGRAHMRLGQHRFGLAPLSEALAVFQEIGDDRGALVVQIDMAATLGGLGRHHESLSVLESLEQLAAHTGSELLQADILHVRCDQLHALGRSAQARSGAEQVLALYDKVGNQEGAGAALLNLVDVELSLGRYAEAQEHSVRLLALERQLGDRYYEAIALEQMGDVHAARGHPDQAQRLYGEAVAVFEEIHSARAAATRDKMT